MGKIAGGEGDEKMKNSEVYLTRKERKATPDEKICEICEEMKSGKSTCKDCEFTVCPSLNYYADKILEILDMKGDKNEKAN